MPVLIEPMENIPVAYSRVKIVDATGNFAGTTMRVAKAVDIKHSLNNKTVDVFGVLEVKMLLWTEQFQKHKLLLHTFPANHQIRNE